jgi:hypothetical protein
LQLSIPDLEEEARLAKAMQDAAAAAATATPAAAAAAAARQVLSGTDFNLSEDDEERENCISWARRHRYQTVSRSSSSSSRLPLHHFSATAPSCPMLLRVLPAEL